jgi:ABC-type lipoprotein release transport system permease subunit
MTKEEMERLDKDRKFYESIVEYEPEQINKQIKDYYEQRNNLFQAEKDNKTLGTMVGCIVLIALIAIIALLVYISTHSYPAY